MLRNENCGIIELQSNGDVNEKIRTLIEKIYGGPLVKISKNYQNYRRHIETD